MRLFIDLISHALDSFLRWIWRNESHWWDNLWFSLAPNCEWLARWAQIVRWIYRWFLITLLFVKLFVERDMQWSWILSWQGSWILYYLLLGTWQAVCFQETNRSFVLEVSRNNISSMWRYERVLAFYIVWHVTYFVMFLVSGRVSVSNSKFHCHWETKWIRGGGTRAGRTYSWARDGWCCNSTKIRLLLRVRGGWEFKGPKQDPKIPHQPK